MKHSIMADDRKQAVPLGNPDPLKPLASVAANGGDEAYQALRQTGGRAWQLHAAMRAADHYIAQDGAADRDTGAWLVACAVDLAEEVSAELDGLARVSKERPADAAPPSTLQKLRTRSYKLHAAARAADHFLDQDGGEDRTTASWLVACALDFAARLAADIDDEASHFKRATNDAPTAFSDVISGRKPAASLRSSIG